MANAGDVQFCGDEQMKWLRSVRDSLEHRSAEELGRPARVFYVPRALHDTKPEAYVPQHFALGPYHHQSRAELRDMERYKLAAAKRAEERFAGGRRIGDLVSHLLKLEDEMRWPYHRVLEQDKETLAWMMAIDTCFLLDFLESYHRDDGSDMVSSAANWINATVRDAMMIENQLPLRVFAEALELRRRATTAARTMTTTLNRFITQVSPIKIRDRAVTIGDEAHLLELLYHYLVPPNQVFDDDGNNTRKNNSLEDVDVDVDVEEQPVADEPEKNNGDEENTVQKALSQINMESLLASRPMRSVSRLYGKMSRRLPALPGLVSVVRKLAASVDVESILKGMNLDGVAGGSPQASEIKIPSVEELAKCGVRFVPTTDGIHGISFNPTSATLYLPVITLDANTEVVLRNLMAYEAVAVRGPLVLSRYTELMNGIIDTTRDVKILKRSRVLLNRMKSSREAADMWNGMCRAARVSKVSRLDHVIKAVNQHRDRTPAVRVRKMLKRYVFGSWRVLTLLASLVLLLMTGLQAFCSAYPCHNSWFGNVLQLDTPPDT